jgi:hypothetical protein
MSAPDLGDATFAETYQPNGRVIITTRIRNVVVSSGGLDVDVATQMVRLMVAKVLSQVG